MYFPLGNCEFLRWIGQNEKGFRSDFDFFCFGQKTYLPIRFHRPAPSPPSSTLFLPRSLRSRSFPLRMFFFLRRAHQGITTCFGRGSGDRREGEI